MTTVATCNLLVEAQILQTTLGGSGITACALALLVSFEPMGRGV